MSEQSHKNLKEFVILGVYVAVNTAILSYLFQRDPVALWERYGDTHMYWDTVFAHMHWCQFMIIQPIVVLVICLMFIPVSSRRKFLWITILVMIAVECLNVSFCFDDAVGLEV